MFLSVKQKTRLSGKSETENQTKEPTNVTNKNAYRNENETLFYHNLPYLIQNP